MDIIGGATAPHDSDPDAEYDFEDDFATDHTRKASADLSSFSSSAPSPASQRLSSRITSDAAANGSNVIMNKIPHTASLSADEGSKVLEGFPAHDAPKASADAIAVSSSAPSPTGLILPFQAPPPVAHHGVNTTPVTTPLRSRPSFSSLGDCGLAEWIHASPPPCEPSDLDHRSNEGTDNMVLPQDDLHTKNHQTSLHLVFEEYFTYYEGEQIRHNSVSLPTGRTQANVIAVIPTGDSRARHMECDVFNIESTSRAPPLEPRGSVFLASQGGKWAIDRSIHSPDTASSSDSGADIGSPGVDGDPNERHVAPAPEDQSSDSSCSVFNTSASPSNSVRKTNSPCEREAAMPPKIRGPSRVEAQPDTPGGIPELADERQIVDRTHHEAGQDYTQQLLPLADQISRAASRTPTNEKENPYTRLPPLHRHRHRVALQFLRGAFQVREPNLQR